MSLTIQTLQAAYQSGKLTPRELVADVHTRIARSENPSVWTHVLNEAELEPYLKRLDEAEPQALPLYGIPFAIKDNIDLAGVPTTAACPEFAYVPEQSAFVVEKLIQAGALPIGKTNLDQFATGLVGTRSPYGVPRNPLAPERIPGGSSSGSAVAVAEGFVSFALGTDTAGSGRVPAAFNGLWGVKPSRGLLSNAGVVPACRTLDCVSIFAQTANDCQTVINSAKGWNPQDAWSTKDALAKGLQQKDVIGIPRNRDLFFFGDAGYEQAWQSAVKELAQRFEIVEVDLTPFIQAARLLYEGPWVAERYLAVRELIEKKPDALHPVTRQIISGGSQGTATEVFSAVYQLAEYKRQADAILAQVAALVTPTAGGFPTLEAVNGDPIGINSQLGYYTNFMNLLDYCAVASPIGVGQGRLPFGITWTAPKGTDAALLALAGGLEEPRVGEAMLPLLLFGEHMQGLSLNPAILALGGVFQQSCRTASRYRLVLVDDVPPDRPGLIACEKGHAIECEQWLLPIASIGKLLAQIRYPLGLGEVELADGSRCHGFVCDGHYGTTARDISECGGWRGWRG